MIFDKKTILACECYAEKESHRGILTSVITHEGIEIVKTVVTGENEDGAQGCGTYLTICQGKLYHGGEFLRDKLSRAVSFSLCELIKELIPTPKRFLFVGLGNRELSSDKIGTGICDFLLPIHKKSVLHPSLSLFSPGILASGGIRAIDHVKGLIQVCGFDAVIVADSLATAHPERLLTTVQISSVGITPASGTKISDERTPNEDERVDGAQEISRKTLGVPVISLGVPTVISFGDKLYTPYTIDGEIEPICKIIADGITLALCKE